MKNAEEIIAGFYHYIKNSEVQDSRNCEAFIHKLNYLILFNPTPTAQDWVGSMVSFASKLANHDGQGQVADTESRHFNDIIEVLRAHYNSLVPENKMLSIQMFEVMRSKQPVLKAI
jgi:hypothetical protein